MRYCQSCGFWVKESGKCRLNSSSKSAKDFCSDHNYNPSVCALCHAYTLNPIIENGKYLCQKCAEAIETCAGCEASQHCKFEEDPSPLPKIVQKQFRQGNSIFQTTVKNPDRIRELCHTCKCWDTKLNDCGRNSNWCGQHSLYAPKGVGSCPYGNDDCAYLEDGECNRQEAKEFMWRNDCPSYLVFTLKEGEQND